MVGDHEGIGSAVGYFFLFFFLLPCFFLFFFFFSPSLSSFLSPFQAPLASHAMRPRLATALVRPRGASRDSALAVPTLQCRALPYLAATCSQNWRLLGLDFLVPHGDTS